MGGGGLGGGMGDGGFDEFDGMDEWDDGFDDGGGGSDTDELEKRLDDLEAEVATLSSTVSTVRSENEEISAAVDDIEEDVRNLLDIYEMVTRGINPFVDESSGFNGGGAADSSFGLFDDEGGDEAEAELDDDVASADADGFFDEELLDEDGLDDEGLDDFDDLEEADDGNEPNDEPDDGDPADAASETESAAEDDDMNDDGKSFSELKEEYDAGEADWADDAGDETAPEGGAFEDGTEPFDDDLDDELGNDAFDDGLGDGPDDAVGAGGEGFEDDPVGAAAAPTGNDHEEPDPAPMAGEPGPTPGGDPAEANGDGFEYVGRDDLAGRRGKPYLTELPGDYVGDLLVMEWLEFLVAESDVTDAVRAVNYYERIEWIGPDAAARLRDFLSGFGTIDRNLVDRPGTDRLVREHHTRSLRYITQLNGTGGHLVLLDRWEDLAGGSLVGGEPPASARGPHDRGHGRRNSRSDGNDEHAHERPNGGTQRDGRDRRPRSDAGNGRNGSSPRPMNDPDPQPDRADPADGGWGDGR